MRREWFSLVCASLFDAKFGLFVPFGDSPAGLVHPNPNRPPHLKVRLIPTSRSILASSSLAWRSKCDSLGINDINPFFIYYSMTIIFFIDFYV